MKKLVIIALCMLMFSGISFATEKELTDLEKHQQQLSGVVARRAQLIKAINNLEIEMIKIQAIIYYLKKSEE